MNAGDRDRDAAGRARNARPRDGLGRPLPRGAEGVGRVPDDLVLAPAESLVEAQRLLDAGMPFHAHEVLEGTWKAAPEHERDLWQGLAQLAVGLTHLLRGNRTGAAALLRRGSERIAPYAAEPPHGVDVSGLLAWVEAATGDSASVVGPPRLRQVDGDPRREFLAERRAASAHRYDTLHSADYDEQWGEIGPVHARFVRRLIERVPSGGEVLDVPCGTGKYWPMLLDAGLRVVGADQSLGMLEQARHKHPEIDSRLLALQDLGTADDLLGRFDGLLCVDSLENVGPEDWPGVTAGLAAVLRPGGPAYVTVEVHPDPLPPPSDPRQVPGELFGGGGYHYYPSREQVIRWLSAAGFAVDDEAEDDDYWHLLVIGQPG